MRRVLLSAWLPLPMLAAGASTAINLAALPTDPNIGWAGWAGWAIGAAVLTALLAGIVMLLLRSRRLAAALASEQALRRQVEKALAESRGELDRLATTDRLTGLLNRRKFEELATIEIGRARRYQHPLSLIVLDIDDFKSINERFGHELGDMLLGELSQRVRTSIRQSDVAARWGGGEFLILAPRAGTDEAVVLAEKLRAMIASAGFHAVEQVTASFGVASLHSNDALRQLVGRVDQALARAKAGGSNRVELENEIGEPV